MEITIKRVHDHYELLYDGHFLCSADTLHEAEAEKENYSLEA